MDGWHNTFAFRTATAQFFTDTAYSRSLRGESDLSDVNVSIEIECEETAGLEEFSECLVDSYDSLVNEGVTYQITRRRSPTVASGLGEIIQLVLALGQVRAFTTLAAVVTQYFLHRPKGKIILKRRWNKDGTIVSEELTAEDVPGEKIERLFDRGRQS